MLTGVEDQTFTADIGNGRHVVMTGWTEVRGDPFAGFSRNIPGTATATVIGLTPRTYYKYALYQYRRDTEDGNTFTINGGVGRSTSSSQYDNPSYAATHLSNDDGELVFTFDRNAWFVEFSGISISNNC